MKTYALLLGLSFLLSALLTPLVRGMAHRFGWLDQPGGRKIHPVPTPRLGGVPIYLAFFLSLLSLLFIDNAITARMRIQWPAMEALPLAITVIFLLGLVDDIYGVKIYIKVLVQIACSLWIFYHGNFIEILRNPFGDAFDVGMWSLPLTVLWLVGLTNALNLIDGIDGLASGVTLFAMATLIIISLIGHNAILIVPLVALSGAVAGFLRYNFHPASIFLGDSGSLFLGFTLATLSLIWVNKTTLAVSMLGPVILFALPIADTALAIVRRYFGGKSIFASDSDHIHHRLLRQGWSPRRVVLVLYASCFLFGLLTLVLVQTAPAIATLAILFLAGGGWLIFTQLGYPEVAEINLTVGRGLLDQRKVISQRVQFARMAESIAQTSNAAELWARLLELAKRLDFDYVELFLSAAPEDGGSKADDNSGRAGFRQKYVKQDTQELWTSHPERFWKIEIPFGEDAQTYSYVVLARATDKKSLYLRVESLVSILSSNLSKCAPNIRAERTQLSC